MENRCICCGAEIPEGRMVCKSCEAKYEYTDTGERFEPHKSLWQRIKEWFHGR